MLLLKDIKGQSNSVRYLENSLSSGRISASYLFSGPSGVGRALTVKAFLSELLFPGYGKGEDPLRDIHEIEKISKKEHPDVKWLMPEKNKNIGISEIREAKDFLYMKPFSSTSNAVVIEDAHMMTQEAANALLKVLEEPPKNSLLVLISDKKELIPATVLSRCSEVRFSGLSEENAKKVIMENSDADEKTAGFLARFSQGSVGRALESLKTGFQERQTAPNEILKNLTCRGRDVFMTWYSEDKGILIDDIDSVIGMLRDAVFIKEGISLPMLQGDPLGEKASWQICKKPTGEIYRTMARLVELKSALMGNVNPKVTAQALPVMISG